MRGLTIVLCVLMSAPWSGVAHSQTYRLIRSIDTQQNSGDGNSTATTHDDDELRERIIARRNGGVELAYDLPPGSGDRASEWHFPARIFRPEHGDPVLLNRDMLASRVDPWLKKGGLTRAMCGKLIFTPPRP